MTKNILTPVFLLGLMHTGIVSADTAATSRDALIALSAASSTGIDTSWVESNDWPGLDTSAESAGGVAWGTLDAAADPCGEDWAGIVCDGEDITHIELPNAKMNSTLEQVFAAIAPIKAQLVSINFSGTTDDASALTGGIPATADGQGYSALVYLALNKVGATGGIPDLSSYTSLQLANFYDNDFTSFTGPVGGAALTSIRLYQNPNLSGSLTAAIAAAPNLVVLRSEGTMLEDGLELPTDVSISAGATAKTAEINWTPATGGLPPASYSVEYTSNNGATWTALPPVTAGNSVTTGVLANGTYGAKVTPKATEGFSGASAFAQTAIVIGDSGTTTGTATGTGTGGSTGTGGGTVSVAGGGGGGGAAFWLLALPLLGLWRLRD